MAAKKKVSESTPPAPWTKNNLACVNTYSCLFVQEQLDDSTGFADAEKLPMRLLTFWSKALDEHQRTFAAEIVAKRMDDYFRAYMFASFHDNSETFLSAKEKLTAMMTTASNTVAQLAATVDTIYLFRGEQ